MTVLRLTIMIMFTLSIWTSHAVSDTFNILEALSGNTTEATCNSVVGDWGEWRRDCWAKRTDNPFVTMGPMILLGEVTPGSHDYQYTRFDLYRSPGDSYVYAFWFCPNSEIVSVDGSTYRNIEEVRPVASTSELEKTLQTNSVIVPLKIPCKTNGIAYFFVGSSIKNKFSWDGWIIFTYMRLNIHNQNWNCPEFEQILKGITSPHDLYTLAKQIDYSNGFSSTPEAVKWQLAHNSYTPTICDNETFWKKWMSNCGIKANFMEAALLRNKDQWHIKAVYYVSIGNWDPQMPFEVQIRVRHAFLVIALDDGSFTTMGAIFDFGTFTSPDVGDVLEQYFEAYKENVLSTVQYGGTDANTVASYMDKMELIVFRANTFVPFNIGDPTWYVYQGLDVLGLDHFSMAQYFGVKDFAAAKIDWFINNIHTLKDIEDFLEGHI